jgi:hypothetical protein
MMDEEVSPSQLKFDEVLQESYKLWSTYGSVANLSNSLPYHCIDLTPLLGQTPAFLGCGKLPGDEPFSFVCEEKDDGLQVCGHSIWRTSNGSCETENKIIPLRLLLAVSDPLKIRFSDNAPLANWPGTQGFSENSRENHITLLFLAWSYILSCKWVELLAHSPRHSCKQSYTMGTPVIDISDFGVGYEIDNDEERWWKAILSFGWEATTTYGDTKYLSPWSVVAAYETSNTSEESFCVGGSDTPSSDVALEYLCRFCRHYELDDQFSASLAAALYIPLLSGTTIPLPLPKNPVIEPRLISTSTLSKDSNSAYLQQRQFLPYYMTLSCNPFGIRSLLCSVFFNIDVECNLVSAWLTPCFAIVDPLIEREEFTKLATLLGNRQPNVAALWLGAIIVGIAKSVIRDVRNALTALDLHAAAWTSTMQTFVTLNPGKVTGPFILREDECRLLFIFGSQSHTKLPRSPWKPFGSTPLTDAELEIQHHANCNCHCLEYLTWHWRCLTEMTLEDPGIKRPPKQRSSENPVFGDIPKSHFFERTELLSKLATRSIFGWLRPKGHPALENFVYQHPWFDSESSDDEEIDGRSDVSDVNLRGKKISTEDWIMGHATEMT